MKRNKIGWMTGSCKCLGWSLNVFPIRTTSHLHVAFIKFFKMQLWVLQAGRHLSIIFYLHFWKIKYQRIWYRIFCLVLWHGFWPHAYIDNWGFSALVEQGSPGMSLHLIVPCEYSHTMVFTGATGCWGFSQRMTYTGTHSSSADLTTLSLVPLSL